MPASSTTDTREDTTSGRQNERKAARHLLCSSNTVARRVGRTIIVRMAHARRVDLLVQLRIELIYSKL